MKRFWVILVGVVAVLVVIFVLGNKGQSGTSTSSTAPEISGIKCETEMVKVHNHVHLTMLNDGKNVELPAGIGIKTDAGCLYWLHIFSMFGGKHSVSLRQGLSKPGKDRACASTSTVRLSLVIRSPSRSISTMY
jgi:hypothetical protein